jgi:hypothetical protein
MWKPDDAWKFFDRGTARKILMSFVASDVAATTANW